MKKAFKLLFVLSLITLLSACGLQDYSNQTIVGRISEINGNVVTLELGEVKESEVDNQLQQTDGAPQFNGEAPLMPGNGTPPEMNGERPEMPGNGTPPEFNGEAPQLPENGELPENNGNMPAEGEMPSFNGEATQTPGNGTPPEFNGERPEMPGNGIPPEMSGQAPQTPGSGNLPETEPVYTFVANGETIEVDLGSVGVSFEDLNKQLSIEVGDVIGVSFGLDNSIENVKFYQISE